jgi:hypothetical protein
MTTLYGHRAPRSSTSEAAEFVKLQLDFMRVVDLGKAPPVDLFPILKYVPERFAKWKRDATDVRRRQEALFGRLVDMVKRRVHSGQENGCFMEEAYQRRDEWGLGSDSMLRYGYKYYICILSFFIFLWAGTWVERFWKDRTHRRLYFNLLFSCLSHIRRCNVRRKRRLTR